MSVITQFRANATGHLSPTPEQRETAREAVQSNFRAKLQGVLRAYAARADQANGTPKAATAGASAATANSEVETQSATEAAGAENELGRDAFLQLLVQQLQNQDPFEPVDNTEMVSQLAEFSALEQQENLNASFEELAGNIDQLNFISAQGLLGRYVEGLDTQGQPVAGVVDSVTLNGSIVVLGIGDRVVPMTTVVGVADQPPEQEAST